VITMLAIPLLITGATLWVWIAQGQADMQAELARRELK
jgi:hypothetical protein